MMGIVLFEKGRRAVGQWPPEMSYDALLAGIEIPYVVMLSQPIGNRQFIDPTDSLTTYPPLTPTPNPPTDNQ